MPHTLLPIPHSNLPTLSIKNSAFTKDGSYAYVKMKYNNICYYFKHEPFANTPAESVILSKLLRPKTWIDNSHVSISPEEKINIPSEPVSRLSVFVKKVCKTYNELPITLSDFQSIILAALKDHPLQIGQSYVIDTQEQVLSHTNNSYIVD